MYISAHGLVFYNFSWSSASSVIDKWCPISRGEMIWYETKKLRRKGKFHFRVDYYFLVAQKTCVILTHSIKDPAVTSVISRGVVSHRKNLKVHKNSFHGTLKGPTLASFLGIGFICLADQKKIVKKSTDLKGNSITLQIRVITHYQICSLLGWAHDWDEPMAQCVELALRWQFCVHGSICHEICF